MKPQNYVQHISNITKPVGVQSASLSHHRMNKTRNFHLPQEVWIQDFTSDPLLTTLCPQNRYNTKLLTSDKLCSSEDFQSACSTGTVNEPGDWEKATFPFPSRHIDHSVNPKWNFHPTEETHETSTDFGRAKISAIFRLWLQLCTVVLQCIE